MLARLGNVLCWLGCIVAGPIIAVYGFVTYMEPYHPDKFGMGLFVVAIAFAVWLVGWRDVDWFSERQGNIRKSWRPSKKDGDAPRD
jgi:hypothetical protein